MPQLNISGTHPAESQASKGKTEDLVSYNVLSSYISGFGGTDLELGASLACR
jgi:hypothetical protein